MKLYLEWLNHCCFKIDQGLIQSVPHNLPEYVEVHHQLECLQCDQVVPFLCGFNVHIFSSRWINRCFLLQPSLRGVMLSNGPSVQNWLCTVDSVLNRQAVGCMVLFSFNPSYMRELRESICDNKVSRNRLLA